MDEKPKIRTRKKVRNIKTMNKASVFSRRLKSSFTRSRTNAKSVEETRQSTPCDYAEETLKNSAQTAVYTAEKPVRKSVSKMGQIAEKKMSLVRPQSLSELPGKKLVKR